MSQTPCVLCIMTEESVAEYKEEFEKLRTSGADFVFENDPDEGLSNVELLSPLVIIVGMELGSMEGLEFLTMIMSTYPDLEAPVVLLPDKADGLPPVIHSRDQFSQESEVDSYDFDKLASLIAKAITKSPNGLSVSKRILPAVKTPTPKPESAMSVSPHDILGDLVGGSADEKPQPASSSAEAKAESLAPEEVESIPSAPPPSQEGAGVLDEPPEMAAEASSVAPSYEPLVTAQKSGNAKWLAIAAAILLVLGVGLFFAFSGGQEQPEERIGSEQSPVQASVAGGATAESFQAAAAGAEGEEADEKSAVDSSAAAAEAEAESAAEEGEPAEAATLTRKLELPLEFQVNSAVPVVSDPEKMNALIKRIEESSLRVELIGHSSAEGPEEMNYSLGRKRAEEVKKLLLQRGIPEKRIVVLSAGPDMPVASNETYEGRLMNRRVSANLID